MKNEKNVIDLQLFGADPEEETPDGAEIFADEGPLFPTYYTGNFFT